MTRHVIGVDGGTTKTIALVANDQGEIISAVRGPGSNWTGIDVEIPMKVVAAVVRDALAEANLGDGDIDLAMFCLAGADWPDDHTRREQYLARCGLARRFTVKNDAFGGLRAGTTRPYGVVIAAGTGINCAIIAPDGREWAYGYYANDGGAADIAQQAIHAVYRQEDGRGPATGLTPAVLERLQVASPEALMRAMVAGELEGGRILSLCPLVFQLADQGDQVAAGIVERQGVTLAEYVTALVPRYGLADMAFDVVLAGSVFKGQGPLLVDTVTQQIHRMAPHASIVRARFEPAVGALLLAYDALGIAADASVMQRLEGTVPAHDLFSTANGGQVTFRARRR